MIYGWEVEPHFGQCMPLGRIVAKLISGQHGDLRDKAEYDFRASEYNHFRNGLSVIVQMPLAAITHAGLYICIWTDTLDIDDSEIVGCQSVQQP